MALWETAVEVAIKKFFEWIGNPFKRKRKVSEIMTDSVDVRELLKEVVENGLLCVDFCYLANAYNGKRKTKDRAFKFRKLVSGYHTDYMFPNFAFLKFRKIPIDDQYSILLEKIIKHGELIVSVWKMEEGWLKSAFIHLQFNTVGYYLVDDDNVRNEVWFLVVGSKTIEETDFKTPDHNYIIRNTIAELKNMIDLQRK